MCLKKPFLLFLTSLIRFNSRLVLVLPVLFLLWQALYIDSKRSDLASISCVFPGYTWNMTGVFFIHVGLLPPLSNFLLIVLEPWGSNAWISTSSLGLLLLWDSFKKIPEEAKVSSPEVHSCNLTCYPAWSSHLTVHKGYSLWVLIRFKGHHIILYH